MILNLYFIDLTHLFIHLLWCHLVIFRIVPQCCQENTVFVQFWWFKIEFYWIELKKNREYFLFVFGFRWFVNWMKSKGWICHVCVCVCWCVCVFWIGYSIWNWIDFELFISCETGRQHLLLFWFVQQILPNFYAY